MGNGSDLRIFLRVKLKLPQTGSLKRYTQMRERVLNERIFVIVFIVPFVFFTRVFVAVEVSRLRRLEEQPSKLRGLSPLLAAGIVQVVAERRCAQAPCSANLITQG